MIEFNNRIIDKLSIYSDLIYKDYLNRAHNNLSAKLGDYSEIKTGKINVNSAVENGKYPFFTCGSECLYIDDYAYNCKAIIISGNGVISCKYYDGKFNAYQRTYVLTPKKYFYLFQKACEFETNNLNINSSGSVIKFITKSMIEQISITLNDYSIITDDRIARIYNLISKYKQKNIVLQKIKQHLLNKYF
ncbi:restriction endonuclease subunit S [Mycoplasmopsis bovirhinis]|uniref:Type I restriction-modification system specificity subunit n=1 Tax=Mycoplasmopsis bovirhinis TaxID=29553 RepID=A0A449AGX4_9BACT|nr:restriction endonuclease subunit S [Mycoplasmopsis bovirhinis]VEU63232.1 type I restriction-modification system specificity subunit [Mycoplasmopsis bovirhinis]VEU64250.1 type I restriction-modification system specificity subunit [Mycoplasmopsis bovirhinis]